MTRTEGSNSASCRLLPVLLAALLIGSGCSERGWGWSSTETAPPAPAETPIAKKSANNKQRAPQPGSANYSGKGGGEGR